MKKIEFNRKKNVIHSCLRQIRMERGISQKELAARLQLLEVNIDQQIISKIENNARLVTDYELACFCFVLQVDPAHLLAEVTKELKK